jgi:hypothetical protein
MSLEETFFNVANVEITRIAFLDAMIYARVTSSSVNKALSD